MLPPTVKLPVTFAKLPMLRLLASTLPVTFKLVPVAAPIFGVVS